jgi:hypothetical protein
MALLVKKNVEVMNRLLFVLQRDVAYRRGVDG